MAWTNWPISPGKELTATAVGELYDAINERRLAAGFSVIADPKPTGGTEINFDLWNIIKNNMPYSGWISADWINGVVFDFPTPLTPPANSEDLASNWNSLSTDLDKMKRIKYQTNNFSTNFSSIDIYTTSDYFFDIPDWNTFKSDIFSTIMNRPMGYTIMVGRWAEGIYSDSSPAPGDEGYTSAAEQFGSFTWNVNVGSCDWTYATTFQMSMDHKSVTDSSYSTSDDENVPVKLLDYNNGSSPLGTFTAQCSSGISFNFLITLSAAPVIVSNKVRILLDYNGIPTSVPSIFSPPPTCSPGPCTSVGQEYNQSITPLPSGVTNLRVTFNFQYGA